MKVNDIESATNMLTVLQHVEENKEGRLANNISPHNADRLLHG